MGTATFVARTFHRLAELGRKPFVRALLGGIATQGILSAANFLIKVWIARNLPKSELGLFELASSTILVFIGLQNALVIAPMLVLLPEKRGASRDVFVSGLAYGQAIGWGPILALGCIALAAFGRAFDGSISPWWAIALAVAVTTAYTREYTRVLYLCEMRIGRVVLMDLLFAASTLTGVFLMGRSSSFSSTRVISLHAAMYLASALLGHTMGKRRYAFDWQGVRSTFRETWHLSKWGLLGSVTHTIQSQAYVYLTSILTDLDQTADVSAARMLLMPFGLIIGSTQRVFITKGAEIRHQKTRGDFTRYILMYLAFLVGIWVVYIAFLFSFQQTLIRWVFTDRYSNIGIYLILWAIYFLINVGAIAVNFTLQALKEFKLLAVWGTVSSLSVLVLCFTLIKALGPIGGVISLIGGEVIIVITLVPRLLVLVRDWRSSVSSGESDNLE